MATLVAIGYPDQGTAEQARETVARLESELSVPCRAPPSRPAPVAPSSASTPALELAEELAIAPRGPSISTA